MTQTPDHKTPDHKTPDHKTPDHKTPDHTDAPEEELEDTRISLPLEALKSALPFLVAFLLILVAGYWLIDPAPPKKMVASISKQDGNYLAYAQLYAALLKPEGITLDVRESAGPLQSVAELRKGDEAGADITLVPDGVASGDSNVGMVSLGSLYYEPLWVFSKKTLRVSHLSALRGKRVAIGLPDSSTSIFAHLLLNAAGVTADNSKLLEMGETEAEDALTRGAVDAVFISGVPTEPQIRRLASMPEVAIADLDEAEAYSRQFTFLHHLVLPEGALDLEHNKPSHDINLLVPTVTLVARESMHPALAYLMLKVVSRVHNGAGVLQHEHEFPADKDTQFELASQAKKFYESGPPFFDRYLPFWAATFLNRVLIVLVPLAALAIPISRIAPSVYIWLVKSRIYKLYGELRFLEMQLRNEHQPLEISAFRGELDSIEHRVNHLHVPVAFSRHLYELRSHIELVRSKIG